MRPIFIVCLAASAVLTGCFDTRGGGRPPPRTDSGPDIILEDSGPVVRCGDGACSSSESCSSCESDCGPCTGSCGDGTCSSSETCSSCEVDCGPCAGGCGDGTCSSSETCSSCELDCGPCAGRCGDETCSSSETCSSCELDCGPCAGSCRSYPVPPYGGVACSSATRTCAEGCADGTCISDCLMADSNPDCWGCAQQNLVSCYIASGCEEEFDCFSTCYEDAGCTSGSTCSTCSSERTAWDDCVLSVTTCGGDWVSCLP